jgi:hypothetical protein
MFACQNQQPSSSAANEQTTTNHLSAIVAQGLEGIIVICLIRKLHGGLENKSVFLNFEPSTWRCFFSAVVFLEHPKPKHDRTMSKHIGH